jgi:succinate-semialdehyde dehydrogenase/glutarate-semialdehyde dehydrogenase
MAYASTNPYTNDVVKTFPYATDADVDAALARAHSAFSKWSRTPLAERVAIFRRAAELLRERTAELGALATLEMGKLLRDAEAEAAYMAAPIFDWVADNAENILKPRPLENSGSDREILMTYEPQGIVYSVQPWNVPFYQAARGFAPAAISGNVVILKHASIVPQCSQAIVDLLTDAGLPEGVWQNLYLTHEQSDRVISDPRIRALTLTGSAAVGSHVAARAGKALRKSVLELGGSDAYIVLPDADLDAAIEGAAARLFVSGQTCVSPKRIIVVDPNYEEFVERLTLSLAPMVGGDPTDPATTLAPLSSQAAADELKAKIDAAVAAGATAIAGGARVPQNGAFVQPTILTDVTPDNPVFYDELFGPVYIVFRVADADAAVQLANDSLYGLAGAVWGADVDEALSVAQRLDTGNVSINAAFPTGTCAQPFGGVKSSGFGRELGSEGVLEFVNIKAITLPPPATEDGAVKSAAPFRVA